MGKILNKNLLIDPSYDLEKYADRQKIKFICPKCGKEDIKTVEAYKRYSCCKKCVLIYMSNNVKKTCLEKYGVANTFQVEKFKEKSKKTKLEKYGDENYTNKEKRRKTNLDKYGSEEYVCIKEFKEKSKKTKLEKYGDENYINKEKSKKTKLEKYGDENYNNRKQCKKTCLEKYGSEQFMQSEIFKEKSFKTMIKKYGVINFRQSPKYAKKYEKTCLKRYGVRHYSQTTEYMEKTHFSYDFNGEHFHSSWELAVWIYCLDNNIKIKRHPISFYYEYEGKSHKYFPDFKIENQYYEVKGDHFISENGEWINPFDKNLNGLCEAKRQCLIKNNVKILDCSDIIKYINDKYGKNYLSSFKIITKKRRK